MVGGNSSIGDQCFVGINATIFSNVHVGNKCLIGGATVIKKSMRDFSRCRVASSTMEYTQFDEETIEDKLLPTKNK